MLSIVLWWKEVVMTVERVRVSFFRERKRWPVCCSSTCYTYVICPDGWNEIKKQKKDVF
ncbi:hypothetical protein HanPSC8_Chr17g0778051 [Helianthus annuus]|nr:hypothetical protein HanPSC8_Chr17g0778051 [Helianthus annuus]